MKKFILGLLIALPFIASATNYGITLHNTSNQKLYINNIQRLGCYTQSEESQPAVLNADSSHGFNESEESQPAVVYPIIIAPKGGYRTYQYYPDSCQNRNISVDVYYTRALGLTNILVLSNANTDSASDPFKRVRTKVSTGLGGDASIYSAACRGASNGHAINANCLAPSSIFTTYRDRNVNVSITVKMKDAPRKVHKLHNRHKG